MQKGMLSKMGAQQTCTFLLPTAALTQDCLHPWRVATWSKFRHLPWKYESLKALRSFCKTCAFITLFTKQVLLYTGSFRLWNQYMQLWNVLDSCHQCFCFLFVWSFCFCLGPENWPQDLHTEIHPQLPPYPFYFISRQDLPESPISPGWVWIYDLPVPASGSPGITGRHHHTQPLMLFLLKFVLFLFLFALLFIV